MCFEDNLLTFDYLITYVCLCVYIQKLGNFFFTDNP